MKKNYLTNKEIKQKQQLATNYSVKCECGHSILVTNKYKRTICSWCGKYVYANDEVKKKYEQQKFIYKLKELLRK